MPITSPELRRHHEHQQQGQWDPLPRRLLGGGLAALVLFNLPALLAGPANPGWLAAGALTGPVIGIPAGLAAYRRRHPPTNGAALQWRDTGRRR